MTSTESAGALSSDEYRAIFDASPDGCLVVARDGSIRACNAPCEALFGWTPDELTGQNVDVLVPEGVRKAHVAHRSSYMRDPRNRPMGVGVELRGRRRDGSTFPVEISLSPWAGDCVVCTVRDVSAHRRLRTFSEGALTAAEEERRRIARELHDDTSQALATLMLRVRTLAEEADPDRRAALLEEIREEIIETADGVKRMARDLRPPEIEELGLELAIAAHVRGLRESRLLRVQTELGPVDSSLGEAAKLALYRIVQEALSNVRRHADVERARLSLTREDGDVVLEVRDEGRGFDLAHAAESGGGLGLVGMEERATMIGGRFTVVSAPGRGTTVRVSVPPEE